MSTNIPRTWTADGVRMLYELEMIDDAFCDIYADTWPKTARAEALLRAIDCLQAWRKQYGFEYEPFMQPTDDGGAA